MSTEAAKASESNMSNTTGVQEKSALLSVNAQCARCGATMGMEGDNYRCPNSTTGGVQDCPAGAVGSGLLVRLVITKLVERIANGDVIDQAMQDIRAETEAQVREQKGRLSATEGGIAELNSFKLSERNQIEERAATYMEAADGIHQANMTAAGLAYESMIARQELDKLEFIRDEEGIRHAATDMETYLESPTPEYAQEMLDLLVQQVLVDRDRAEIVYSVPMPTAGYPEGVLKETIPLE